PHCPSDRRSRGTPCRPPPCPWTSLRRLASAIVGNDAHHISPVAVRVTDCSAGPQWHVATDTRLPALGETEPSYLERSGAASTRAAARLSASWSRRRCDRDVHQRRPADRRGSRRDATRGCAHRSVRSSLSWPADAKAAGSRAVVLPPLCSSS